MTVLKTFLPLGLTTFFLLVNTSAEAHVKLLSSRPAGEAHVVALSEITLTFDSTPIPGAAALKDSKGQDVAVLGPAQVKGAVLSIPLSHALSAGQYELSFRVSAPDAHVTTGKILFTVDAAAGTGE